MRYKVEVWIKCLPTDILASSYNVFCFVSNKILVVHTLMLFLQSCGDRFSFLQAFSQLKTITFIINKNIQPIVLFRLRYNSILMENHWEVKGQRGRLQCLSWRSLNRTDLNPGSAGGCYQGRKSCLQSKKNRSRGMED